MKPNQNGLVTQIPIKNKAGKVIGHKEVVTYRGLLARAHEEHLVGIETTVVQFPGDGNGQTAVVQAKVTTSKGTFSAVGDANPGNVNPMIAPHVIRMAETRAKARAIRDAVNIGLVAIEELGADFDGEGLHEGNFVAAETGADAHPAAPGNGGGTGTPPDQGHTGDLPQDRGNGSPESMTESQRRYLFRLLAGKGVLGEAAKDWLLARFQVRALKDAPKNAASAVIDELVKAAGKGGNGEGGHAHPA